MMKRILLFLIFGIFLLNAIFASCQDQKCPTEFKGEYRNETGIIIAPKGLKVIAGKECIDRSWERWCSNTAHECKTKGEWKSKIYISSNKTIVNITCNYTEEFIGTEDDIINAIKNNSYSIYLFEDGTVQKVKYILPINKSYFPSLDEALKERNYNVLGDEILYEFIIPGLKNFTKLNNGTYNHISDAEGELIFNQTLTNEFIFNGTVWLNVAYKEIREKVIKENESFFGNIIYLIVDNNKIEKECKEVRIENKTLYCDNNIIAKNVTKAKVGYYVIKNKEIKLHLGNKDFCNCTKLSLINNTLYCDNRTLFTNVTNVTVKYYVYINYEDIFYDLQDKIKSEYKCEVKTSGVEFEGEEYTFNKPGLYYLSDDAIPKTENQPILIVEPKLTGITHTTIYPENKIEEHELFNITAIGVGLHNITIKIGSYSREFIVPEGTNIVGKIVLDFNKNKLFIKYFVNGNYNSTGYVRNLTNCLHKDCDISYEIWYDDGYGFETYKPKLFAKGNISIRWTSLSYLIEKTTIYWNNPFTIKIRVKNLGPRTAKEVNIYNLSYNSSCLKLFTGNSVNINLDEDKILEINGKIKSFNCEPKDYKISFNIYGWNTYKYPVTLKIPISKVTHPKEGTLISKNSKITTIDYNSNFCLVKTNSYEDNRTCNSNYSIYYLCEKSDQADCYVKVISGNDYFKFVSKEYHYITEAYLNISHIKTKMEDNKEAIFKLQIEDIKDPNVNAKDLVISVFYNNTCLNVKILNATSDIKVGETKNVTVSIKKIRDFCREKDYNILFKIKGYNTKEYTYIVKVPISKITFPKNESLLTSETLFEIWYANSERCYLIVNNTRINFNCLNVIVNPFDYCIYYCPVELISENRYFEYHEKYLYSLPNNFVGSIVLFIPQVLVAYTGEANILSIKMYSRKEINYKIEISGIFEFAKILDKVNVKNKVIVFEGKFRGNKEIRLRFLPYKLGIYTITVKVEAGDKVKIFNIKVYTVLRQKERKTLTISEKIIMPMLFLLRTS